MSAKKHFSVINKLIEHDRLYWARGEPILAWDEAGYGSLCGSMYVACAQYPLDFEPPPSLLKVNDSKKLTESVRFELAEEIKKYAAYHIVKISVEEVNSGNPYWLRFTEAKKHIEDRPPVKETAVIFDGDRSITGINFKSESLVKGDAKSFSIASAAILAKTAKDSEMIELDKIYPEYSLASNKGYGTADHIAAIKKHGLSPAHRIHYCSKFI